MNKTLIVMATLAAIASFVQAEEIEIGQDNKFETGFIGQDVWQTTNANTNLSVTGGNVSISTKDKVVGLFVKSDNVVTFGEKNQLLEEVSFSREERESGALAVIDHGTLNVHAHTLSLNGSKDGLQLQDDNSYLNLDVEEFIADTGMTAIHVREGLGVANIGSADKRVKTFKASRTVVDSGVSLLQVNEGGTINIFADKMILSASNDLVGGGTIGSGSWGTVNIDANDLIINGSIDGDYGAVGASAEGNVLAVNIVAKKLTMTGDIKSGVNGDGSQVSNAIHRAEKFNIVATDASSKITGDVVSSNKSETTINFINGGTFTGDIITKNLNVSGVEGIATTVTQSKVALDGQMVYKGNVSMEGGSQLDLAGKIDAREGKINSSEDSLVKVTGQASFGSVTSSSTAGVHIANNAVIQVSNGLTAIANLNADNGTLAMTANATTEIGTLKGLTTVVVDNANNTAKIDTLTQGASISAIGSSEFNQQFASSEAAAAHLITQIVKTDGGSTETSAVSNVKVEASETNGTYEAEVKDGVVDEASVQKTLNNKTRQVGETLAFNVLSWRLEMNDMNKRLGELRDSEGNTGVWARVNAGEQEYGDSNNEFQQLQFGADTKVDALAGIHVGGAFSYTKADLSYKGGSGDNDIYGVAAYGSWLGEGGSFVDVIAKVARLESESTVYGTTADFDTTAYSLSAEIGHRFEVGSLAFIEPQLEMNWGYVDGKSFNTVSSSGIRAATEFDSVESLVGRAGFRAGLTCPNNKGNVYVRASVLREFDGDVTVTRGDGAYEQDMGDTWFEFGIGGNWNISPNAQIYADLERTTSADLEEPWRFNIGARYAF